VNIDLHGTEIYRSYDGSGSIRCYVIEHLTLDFFYRGYERWTWQMTEDTYHAFLAALHDVEKLQPGEVLVWMHNTLAFDVRREPSVYTVRFEHMPWSYSFDVGQMRGFVASLEKIAG